MADQNFSMYAGDTKRIEVTVVDAAGDAVDITDFTSIRWKMAKTVKATAVLEKSLGDGIEIISGGSGRFDVTLETGDTESLRPGTYYHEAEVADPVASPEVVATVMTGTAEILPTLIKPETSP